MFEGYKKGQVSTEYLVILAVVLVIALAVVFLVSGGSSGLAGGISESQSQSYWASTSPLAITGYKLSGTTLDLTLVNNDAQSLTLTAISVDGTDRYTTSTQFTPGQTRTVAVSSAVGTDCAEGTAFSLAMKFTYVKGNISGIDQTGDKALVGTCS